MSKNDKKQEILELLDQIESSNEYALFLIYGTVKYDSPAKKTADGKFSLKLNGEITCMNLLNGDIFSKIQLSVTTVQDKEWSCKLEASKLLAEEFAKKIPYAL